MYNQGKINLNKQNFDNENINKYESYLEKEKIKAFLNLISTGEHISNEVNSIFKLIGEELIESVLKSSVKLANLKQTAILKPEDVKLVFENKHKINIPPLSGAPIYQKNTQPLDENSSHMKRLAMIRTHHALGHSVSQFKN